MVEIPYEVCCILPRPGLYKGPGETAFSTVISPWRANGKNIKFSMVIISPLVSHGEIIVENLISPGFWSDLIQSWMII